jgi:hypothetical protein
MGPRIGLWVDHKKAIIVSITEYGEEISHVISKVEKQARRSGDSPLKGAYDSYQVPPEDRKQNAYTRHLNIYFDAVIAVIRNAEEIFIFGPGEAKIELKKRLEKKKMTERIRGFEAVDKMTDRQFALMIRERLAE